ncbi:hypothetical protein CK203_024656 [Vitis vinifera]|uniref:Uncharacterized protein n=1 Tax=Vitis vinifera TaxID=29760 RepID=A0A438IUB8_VITVI|nr:hypothetical protein CK203_024656 [Vitis vinifera]
MEKHKNTSIGDHGSSIPHNNHNSEAPSPQPFTTQPSSAISIPKPTSEKTAIHGTSLMRNSDPSGPNGDDGTDSTVPNIKIPSTELASLRAPWEHCLIAKVLGKRVRLRYYYDLLEGGPWLIHQHYITLRQWTPNFKPSEAITTHLKVWVDLLELPMEYYDKEVLLRVGAAIGKPVKIHPITERRERVRFARLTFHLIVLAPSANSMPKPKERKSEPYQKGCLGNELALSGSGFIVFEQETPLDPTAESKATKGESVATTSASISFPDHIGKNCRPNKSIEGKQHLQLGESTSSSSMNIKTSFIPVEETLSGCSRTPSEPRQRQTSPPSLFPTLTTINKNPAPRQDLAQNRLLLLPTLVYNALWHGWWHASRVLGGLIGTKQGLVAPIVARMVAFIACLGSIPEHHARPRGTRHGTCGGTSRISWLDSRAPCKAPWHASWHGRWHASRVLARLLSTIQGPVARIMAWSVAHVMCLGLARGYHPRPRGTRQDTDGGTRHVSWLGSGAPCKVRGTRHGKGGGTRRVSWLSSQAPCKVPWHASWHEQ